MNESKAGLKVKCPNCKGSFHILTDSYDPSILPNGSMVQLIEPYLRQKWSTFADGLGAHKGTAYSNMRCPSCSASMLVKNRLVVIPEPAPEPEFVCDVCQKVCKSLLGLNSHKRSHKDEI